MINKCVKFMTRKILIPILGKTINKIKYNSNFYNFLVDIFNVE